MLFLVLLLLFFLIYLIGYFVFRKIVPHVLKKCFSSVNLTMGKSIFSIDHLECESEQLYFDMTNFKFIINLLSLFDFSSQPLFMLRFTKMIVKIPEIPVKKGDNNEKITNKDSENIISDSQKKNQTMKKTTLHSWILKRVALYFLPFLIRRFGIDIHDIEIQIGDYFLTIKSITQLYKKTKTNIFDEFLITKISVSNQTQNMNLIVLPKIGFSINADINILKLIFSFNLNNVSFQIGNSSFDKKENTKAFNLTVQNGVSMIQIDQIFISNKNFPNESLCSINFCPIEIKYPILDPEIPFLEISIESIIGCLNNISLSNISAADQSRIILHIPKIDYNHNLVHIHSINCELCYPFLLNYALLIQLVYKGNKKTPKQINIPILLNIDSISIMLHVSDNHKFDIKLPNGVKLSNGNEMFIQYGSVNIYNHDNKRFYNLANMKNSKIVFENSLSFIINGEKASVYLSPTLYLLSYFKTVTKSFSYLIEIIKGPLYRQNDFSYPTPMKIQASFTDFKVNVLNNELTEKVLKSNYVKSLLQNIAIQEDEFKRIQQLFSVYKNLMKKLSTETQKENNKIYSENEIFAVFSFRDMKVSADGLCFKGKKETYEKIMEEFDLTEENSEILKMTALKVIYQSKTSNLFANIGLPHSKFELSSVNDFLIETELFLLDRLPKEIKDIFYNEITFENEKVRIPMNSVQSLVIANDFRMKYDKWIINIIPSIFTYVADSQLISNKLTQKLIKFPKVSFFDQLRLTTLIIGEFHIRKLRLNIVSDINKLYTSKLSEPKSILMSILINNFKFKLYPLTYSSTFDNIKIYLPKNSKLMKTNPTLINKDVLFIKIPSLKIDMKITSQNNNNLSMIENISSFLEVNSHNMLDDDIDPYYKIRSHLMTFNIRLKFNYQTDTEGNQEEKNETSSIVVYFDYIQLLIDNFLSENKFAFRNIKQLFRKNPKTRFIINARIEEFSLPTILIIFRKHIINVNVSQIKAEKMDEITDFSIKQINVIFYGSDNEILSIIDLKLLSGSINQSITTMKLNNLEMDIFNIMLLSIFMKLFVANNMPNKKRFNKVAKISPKSSLENIMNIFDTPYFSFIISNTRIQIIHKDITIPPSLTFNELIIENRKSSKMNGHFSIMNFDEFIVQALSDINLPLLKVLGMKVNFATCGDRIFLFGELYQGLEMNIQSKVINALTTYFLPNIPKLEEIIQFQQTRITKNKLIQLLETEQFEKIDKFEDEFDFDFHLSQDELSKNDLSKKNTSQNSQKRVNKQNNALENNINETNKFYCHYTLDVTGNINIGLIGSEGQRENKKISTLTSNLIYFEHILDEDGSITDNLTVGNLEIINELITNEMIAEHKNLSKYQKTLTTLSSLYQDRENYQNLKLHPILEIVLYKHKKAMKGFDNIKMMIQPIVCNITSNLILTLSDNFKELAEYNIFDLERIYKEFVQNKESFITKDNSMKSLYNKTTQKNPGFYKKIEISEMKIRMSYLTDNSILKYIEDRELSIEPIQIDDFYGSKENISQLMRKKMAAAIVKSLPTIVMRAKDK
ncbi:hypothetical protein TRFO_26052 [Tritrichomonas foetus]|uniref:Uncharacterized protein n=1 Tax=Tritrichomonas foetus TaxID=1144522 RepID=A0A1J4K974_9EUKA|nr:hypothetical protein TRFO_26052 [Tritrichomonas foetus]|eukprot:OHT05989.1 hypothetical protein TRFO_26052 [Tritrichomonas foetus]